MLTVRMESRALLEKKLAESFAEPWGTRGTLRPEIVALTEDPVTGGVSGTLRFHVSTRSGNEALALEHPFGPLESKDDVDDCLAEALSRLLAVHSSWPR
ncbi:hypothetical protein GWE18_09080 [Bradyrhizobium sp. CSA112]|uniref:hypothetical protein n=1 Tax=Bradyrhizobium sp. CSA112 TaxID=2699170 RepID=UPI0023AEABE5|nr:hypothetical protein [Bradyrhizobium sp. CSA112]MDE5453012.1 hypothetical protein [Bradyrhizobium sp. CSA112]